MSTLYDDLHMLRAESVGDFLGIANNLEAWNHNGRWSELVMKTACESIIAAAKKHRDGMVAVERKYAQKLDANVRELAELVDRHFEQKAGGLAV